MWQNMPLYALAWVFLLRFVLMCVDCVLIDLPDDISFVEIEFN